MNRIALAIIVVLSTQGVGCGCGGSGGDNGGESGVAGSAQAAPTGFTATAFGSARINLSWSYGAETDGFKIQRGTDGATFANIATVGKTVRDFADLRLDPATKFYYRIRGYSAAGDGAHSTIVSATTGAMAWSQGPTLADIVGREAHAAVYANQSMIFCGGRTAASEVTNHVGHLSMTSPGGWTNPSSMSDARSGHSAIYDAANNRIVVFGGSVTASGLTNSVLQYSLTATPSWSPVTTTSVTVPEPRQYHSAIYDSANQRMIVFGGRQPNDGILGDVWALSLPAPAETHVWTKLADTISRELHTAVYDAPNQRMIVFGGSYTTLGASPVYTAYNDVYAVSLSGLFSIVPLSPTGTPPSVRDGAAAIHDSANQRMVLFGGKTGVNLFSKEVWELSLPVGGAPAWKLLSPSGETASLPRMRHSAVYDSVNQRMVLFGGANSETYYNDTWFLGL